MPSHVQICVTPRTTAHQAPLTMRFLRQEYWSEVPLTPPRNLLNPGTELPSLASPALAGGFFTTSTTWEALWWHHMVNTEIRLIRFFAAKDGEALSIWSTKTRPGADCGSYHELLIAKFRVKLKKIGKITRPFRYDLNHILCGYIVEVTNRIRGLDMVDRVTEKLDGHS